MSERLAAQTAFLTEAERLKSVLRASRLNDGSRRENSAEHSWHICLYALTLAEHATRRALEAAGRDAQDIDLIIVATTTPDRVFPSTACLLQKRLDRHGCAAFDIQAVCTGFVYALSVADKFVRSGEARNALVIGAEALSKMTDWTDRHTCVLFGDGAGAVVLQPSSEPGIISTHIHADGQYKDLLYFPSGVSKKPEDFHARRDFIQMRGNEVFKVAVNTLGRIVDETLAAMDEVGRSLPAKLRCTALGGLSVTPASRAIAKRLKSEKGQEVGI